MNYPFFKSILILIISSILFSGCYEDYLIINSDFKSGIIDSDSNQIFFFHFLSAGQPPKGISRFPDGGTQRKIYKNVSLYSYNISEKKLFKIHDFEGVPFHPVLEHISLQNNNLLFSLSPLMGWHWIKKEKTDSIDKRIYLKYS